MHKCFGRRWQGVAWPVQCRCCESALNAWLQLDQRAVLCMQGGGRTSYSCTMSCLELYNELVTDLLAPGAAASKSLLLREDAHAGVFVEGLIQRQVLNGAHVRTFCSVAAHKLGCACGR